jgi:hypothetical protein
MDNQKIRFPIFSAILLVGFCSCDPEDAIQPNDEEFDVNDEKGPKLGEIDANEPETAEVINDPLQADFNGDGYADLAIGAPYDDQSGTRSGSVNVIYGSADGLTTEGNQIWHHGNIDFVGVVTADENDQFGSALAAGDFNNDTYADLAIGALGDDVGGQAHAGSVTILYGSENGLTEDGELWVQGPILDTAEQGDAFGSALTTGDFGHDGADDLVIGVPNEDIGSLPAGVNAGAVNVIYGVSMVGLTATNAQFLFQGGGLTGGAIVELNDHLGAALAAGDFDGDGDDDLAIGVPDEGLPDGIGTQEDVGLVHVVDGSGTGLTTPASEIWYQGSPLIENDPHVSDRFGKALAAGDFDNDGADDLAIGVPFEDVGLALDAGAVNVIYGVANTGLTGAGDQFSLRVTSTGTRATTWRSAHRARIWAATTSMPERSM